MKHAPGLLAIAVTIAAAGCGDNAVPGTTDGGGGAADASATEADAAVDATVARTDAGPLFPPRPECAGDPIAPLAGRHPMVIAALAIGERADGFDLDGDGSPDNKLDAVGALAGDALAEAVADYSLVLPLEFFDFPTVGPDACVKFAVYAGIYKFDRDLDQAMSAAASGDCDDGDGAVHRGVAEVAGNFKDDDCDGLADELDDGQGNVTPSTDAVDRDDDGVTIAAGDCDDTADRGAAVGAGPERCDDGRDNDCDGVADRGRAGGSGFACDLYDLSPEPVALDPSSFDAEGAPEIAFTAGSVTRDGDALRLEAGPSRFAVAVPIGVGGLVLDLRVSGALIVAELEETAAGLRLTGGRLGGVIDARAAESVRGLSLDIIGLEPQHSLLDAVFANLLGSLLNLRTAGPMYPRCRTPDIDVDGDGLEIFCDSEPGDDIKAVDLCVDGDGTEIRDEVDDAGEVTRQCSEALDDAGEPRFVDGISVEFNFSTVPTILPAAPAAP